MHLTGLSAGKAFIREVARTGQTIGTVHTLGALHLGHAELIRRAALENDVAIVTVYPNKIQLRPGGSYDFNLDDDIGLALRSGATAVISSSDTEMFPVGYRTYVSQGDCDLRLGGPETYLKEAVTGAIRWICYSRPTRSYFGLKDIGQAILVKSAVADLLLDCEIRFVPTVRYKNGVPISSRLRRFNRSELDELSCLFTALNRSREEIARGASSVKDLVASATSRIEFRQFRLEFVRIVDADNFKDLEQVKLPFLIIGAAMAHGLTVSDSIYVPDQDTLLNGAQDIWIDLPKQS
ncbi:pantoate--beta-alanine ligase [Bradyrhizobium diazoefficiens]|uniref:pantoate--beta-alanine ligase (AMP-forming) n=1 Tax=Bradyrhizobium diazoefficiens SEMIA 5080 TaxID=754504 RepID=A0A837CA37_9BRAD|nr:pantoate--beta-alanine ligase [Bradyrhizobium diazoefficiens]APO50468.1 pantoate--beta-alanine ligase [Bradyrhizobium diazoefficiens]KGJ66089.1 putative Pantoate--beta-alanine ligase [Bradyrhizobium diazoefficiens SEMIA 5080]KOY04712.1 pantoate--beta-alanine ligase [Bradyrhizobium diazoefficiens]MCD9298614.1 pantoate--beta-alanine ligase [Bradyrhizobium diazoefficiens]MCD9815931.1 pantoate--beta-alanine ligase [Bradyrhizobium diazoefficiens]